MMDLTPDRKFKITLAGAAVVILAAGGFGWNVSATLSSINQSIKATASKLDAVETKLTDRLNSFELTMQDRFSKTAAAEWALRFQILNQQIRIPDPRDPSRLLGESPRSDSTTREVRR